MSEKLTIKIPLLVGGDGKWAAQAHYKVAPENVDWDELDEYCDYEKPLVRPKRYWVTVEISPPANEIEEIKGFVSAGEDS